MNNNELCFGQRIDPELGILEPWYTNPAMDRIKQMDLSDKVIGEWGGGGSTVWWAEKAKEVWSADHNQEWFELTDKQLKERGLFHKAVIGLIDTHEGDQSIMRDRYVKAFEGKKIDIAIADGIHRFECCEYAVKILKPEILIVDNHQQDYVFICPKLDELLEGVRMERFIQENHTDHSGRPWATAIFYLNEKQ